MLFVLHDLHIFHNINIISPFFAFIWWFSIILDLVGLVRLGYMYLNWRVKGKNDRHEKE